MYGKEEIIIKLSKQKLALMLIGCVAFVTAGVLFMLNPGHYKSIMYRNSYFIFMVGLAGVLFFGLIGFLLIKKLFNSSPGLIISSDGITDNSSGLSVGFIPWSDIKAIKEKQVRKQLFLNIIVKDPQKYIDKQANYFKRKAMQANNNFFGSCVAVTANGLQTNHSALKLLLEKKFNEFGKSAKELS